MFWQLHAAFINGQMTTPSHDHSGHVTQVGGVSGGSHGLYLCPEAAETSGASN